MKRIVSVLIAAVMLLCAVASAEQSLEYIEAPYAVADGASVTDAYFDPVVYTGKSGYSVSVTLLGVLKTDGEYFKDIDNDHALDVFEDWRLEPSVRAENLLAHLTQEQKIGFLRMDMHCIPAAATPEEAARDNGSIDPAKLLPGADALIGGGVCHGVYAAEAPCDAAVAALMNNAGNQYAEAAAVASGAPALPWTMIAAFDAAGVMQLPGASVYIMNDPAATVVMDREVRAAQGLRLMAELPPELFGEETAKGLTGMYQGEAIDRASIVMIGAYTGGDGDAAEILAGADVQAALDQGLITPAQLDAAVAARLACEIAMGRLDDPYVNPAFADYLYAAAAAQLDSRQ